MKEDVSENASLKTELPDLVKNISERSSEAQKSDLKVDVTDAAVLMAADGYGYGYVRGKQEGETVVIRTSDTIKNFSLDKKADPQKLFDKAYREFVKIQKERHMDHT